MRSRMALCSLSRRLTSEVSVSKLRGTHFVAPSFKAGRRGCRLVSVAVFSHRRSPFPVTALCAHLTLTSELYTEPFRRC
jgi:hypothetical protein